MKDTTAETALGIALTARAIALATVAVLRDMAIENFDEKFRDAVDPYLDNISFARLPAPAREAYRTTMTELRRLLPALPSDKENPD